MDGKDCPYCGGTGYMPNHTYWLSVRLGTEQDDCPWIECPICERGEDIETGRETY